MTTDFILDYIISAVDVALILYFASKFLTNVKAGWKGIAGIIILQTFINNSVGSFVGDGNPIGLVLMVLTTGLLYKLIFRERIFSIYMFIFIALILMFIAEAVAVLVVLAFGMMPTEIHSNVFAKILAASISKGLYFAFVWHFVPKIKYFNAISKMKAYQILLVCMFNIIIIFMAFWFYSNTDLIIIQEHSVYYIIFTTIGAGIFSMGILAITKGIVSQSQKEAEWLVRETEYKRQMFYVGNTQDMVKSISAQRHDFNNHINCLYGLLKLNKLEEAQSYIEKLVEETSKFNMIIDTGNSVLTALLNTKLVAAQREKIYMEADAELPEDIGIESIDLSIIVGNLLDNALEACRDQSITYKYIEAEIYIKNSNLIIKICNSKSDRIHLEQRIEKAGFTIKEDSSNHGFGLSNIRQAVSKYGGIVKFEDHGDSFAANIAIPL